MNDAELEALLAEPLPVRVCHTCRRSHTFCPGEPRWDADKTVLENGWVTGERCPECGHELEDIEAWEAEGGATPRPPTTLRDPEFRSQASYTQRLIDEWCPNDACSDYPPCGGCGECTKSQIWYGLGVLWGLNS